MFIAHQNCPSLVLCVKHILTVYDVYGVNLHVGYQGNVCVQVMLALFLEEMNIPTCIFTRYRIMKFIWGWG